MLILAGESKKPWRGPVKWPRGIVRRKVGMCGVSGCDDDAVQFKTETDEGDVYSFRLWCPKHLEDRRKEIERAGGKVIPFVLREPDAIDD